MILGAFHLIGWEEMASRVRLDVRRNFLHEKAGQALEQDAQELVESPPLGRFKRCVDVVTGDMV